MAHPDPEHVMAEITGPRPFLERVQIALSVSRMELAHALAISQVELDQLLKLPRVKLAPRDPLWDDVMQLLDARIGACTAMREEVSTFMAGRP